MSSGIWSKDGNEKFSFIPEFKSRSKFKISPIQNRFVKKMFNSAVYANTRVTIPYSAGGNTLV